MPLFRNSELSPNIKLGIWRITETLDDLLDGFCMNENEFQFYSKFTSDDRKKQWLATRKLIRILSGRTDLWIKHDENRKPNIMGEDLEISISHTEDYAAIILGKSKALGIDIEKVHHRILRIKHKFIREDEFAFLDEENEYLTQLFLIWSAKEALFKYYEKGNVDFKEHLQISPYSLQQNGFLKAQINCGHLKQKVNLKYEIINNHVLVYTHPDLSS